MVIVYYTLRLFLLYPYLEEVQKGRRFYVYEDWIRQMRIDTINICGVYLRAVHEYINWILVAQLTTETHVMQVRGTAFATTMRFLIIWINLSIAIL
jgi:hypothetical protein